MEKLCEKLNGFMRTFDSGKGDPALLPEAKFSAMKLLELMAKYKPSPISTWQLSGIW